MDECKALLENIKSEQEKTNLLLGQLVLLLGGTLPDSNIGGGAI